MKSVLRSVRKRKKSKCLGNIEIVDRAAYQGLELDTKVELIRGLIPLGLMHIQELLDDEVVVLAGPRYARKHTLGTGMRHGTNPGSVPLAGQRVPIRVPRVRGPRAELPLQSYAALQAPEKRFLGFVETDTENERVLTPFLRALIERGLDASAGLLVVLDGGRGLRAAVKRAFSGEALVQRCQWHKRENVVSYLPKAEQAAWRARLQRAYDRPTYTEARAALKALHTELDECNQSAAASLAEGLEETLTLHRLGVYGVLGCSLKTTNCLESVNALIEERCAKVDAWKNSNQRQRWLATALLDIEPRLRRVRGFRHLSKLRQALIRELKIKTTGDETQRAA